MQKKTTILRQLSEKAQLSMAKGAIHFLEKTGQLKTKSTDKEIEEMFNKIKR
jgi:hypothetical protein